MSVSLSLVNFSLSTCLKQADAILSSKKIIEELRSINDKLSSLTDKDLHAGWSFIKNASFATNEETAEMNIREAYKSFVKACGIYNENISNEMLFELAAATEASWLIRKINGIKFSPQEAKEKMQKAEKMHNAQIGAAFCAFLMGDTNISLSYLDDSLRLTKEMVVCISSISRNFSDNINSLILHAVTDPYRDVFEAIEYIREICPKAEYNCKNYIFLKDKMIGCPV